MWFGWPVAPGWHTGDKLFSGMLRYLRCDREGLRIGGKRYFELHYVNNTNKFFNLEDFPILLNTPKGNEASMMNPGYMTFTPE